MGRRAEAGKGEHLQRAGGQKWHGLPAGTVPENNLALRDKTGLRVLTLHTDDLVSTRAATAAAPACLLLLFCQKDREASLLQHRDVITLLRGNHTVVMSSPCCEVIIQEQHLLCTGKFQVL